MVELRPYQHQLLEDIREAMRQGHRRVLAVMPTGSGKGTTIAAMVASAAARGHRVLILAHRAELVADLSQRIHGFGINHGVIASGYREDLRHPVQVGSVQTVVRRLDRIPAPSMLVQDECFPAGTLVDGRPIESWRPGELVHCYDHATERVVLRPVVRLFKNKAPAAMVTVRFSNGSHFTCTPDHPVYADSRYVPAAQLRLGANVMASTMSLPDHVPDPLRHVWRSRWSTHQAASRCGTQAGWLGLLLKTVLRSLQILGFFYDRCKHQPQTRIRTNAEAQPNATRRSARQGINYSSCYGLEASKTRWQRHWANGCSDVACFDARVGNGNSREDWLFIRQREWLSTLLQAGRRMLAVAHWCRDRWPKPLRTGQKTTGSKKGQSFAVAWVESVEVLEQRSHSGPDQSCSDCFVYNLEVAEHHNYFAEGVLVHNCHHLIAGNMWGKVLEQWPAAYLIGKTATPERLSGEGLGEGHGGFFTSMVLGPDAGWLTEQGFLVRARIYAPPGLDLSGIRRFDTRKGHEQAEARLQQGQAMGDAVSHYRRTIEPVHNGTAICFCCSVAHAEAVAEAFRAQGISAAMLDGNTDRGVRKRLINDLGTGQLKVLTSCDIISEGTDIPSVTGAILLRPTDSLGLHLQQVGRVLRPCPGKPWSVINDHVGNTLRHGLPTDPREWSLEGRPKGKARKSDAIPIRICPACFSAIPSAMNPCSECGHVVEQARRELQVVEGTLQELDSRQLGSEMRRAERREVAKARTREELEAIARERGYKPGWVAHMLAARGQPHARRAFG